ncbi:MAG TPA: Smr/MutS family protein [Methylomirabilota bacterium]|nr:Smr/MutS family protein [Methylomirabilota bacterium]
MAPEVPPASPSGDEEPLEIPIEDSLDLHTFRPAEVRSVVEEYLAAAQARGFTEVRLIHGRGTGHQRAMVRSLLSGHALVASFADAPAERGGWGATVVTLRRS